MKSKSLRLKLWQEIIYFIFIAIAPVVVVGCEVFSSHSTPFKITFSAIGSVLLVIVILRKFVFNNYIKRLQDECVQLEHDYSINVGDEDLCKRKWTICNLVIYIYHSLVVILSLILAYTFITALSEQLITFRGASMLILGSVLLALMFKLFCYLRIYLSTKKANKEEDNETKS